MKIIVGAKHIQHPRNLHLCLNLPNCAYGYYIDVLYNKRPKKTNNLLTKVNTSNGNCLNGHENQERLNVLYYTYYKSCTLVESGVLLVRWGG